MNDHDRSRIRKRKSNDTLSIQIVLVRVIGVEEFVHEAGRCPKLFPCPVATGISRRGRRVSFKGVSRSGSGPRGKRCLCGLSSFIA